MLFARLPPVAFLVGAAAAGLGAYAARAMPLVVSVLVLLSVSLAGVFWIRARRSSRSQLHDPAISTLVFPPESKFD